VSHWYNRPPKYSQASTTDIFITVVCTVFSCQVSLNQCSTFTFITVHLPDVHNKALYCSARPDLQIRICHSLYHQCRASHYVPRFTDSAHSGRRVWHSPCQAADS